MDISSGGNWLAIFPHLVSFASASIFMVSAASKAHLHALAELPVSRHTPENLCMEERRKDPRHRALKAGKIAFNHGGVIDCIVRNLSRSGARLDVVNQFGIPDQFVLLIERDNLQYSCYVEWRKENQIGVSFRPKDP